MAQSPYIILDDQISPHSRYYQAPLRLIEAYQADEVIFAFEAIEQALSQGLYVAGYLAYECGYIFEPKLAALLPTHTPHPLLQFGVFESFEAALPFSPLHPPKLDPIRLRPQWDEESYAQQFAAVKGYIKAGDVYQINLTFPMYGDFKGTALELYQGLRHHQPGGYGAIISLGGPDIISFSPELFFKKTGQNITSHPMKGTAPRFHDPDQDRAVKEQMQQDEKSRAENLMIVDLLRNDLSRISQTSSVKVPELFSLETYPTLHQMISKISARLRPDISPYDIMTNLFPCGSVTGAPKIRAMEIIQALENKPRGAYCGAIGYFDPHGDACFNVAIRTAILDHGTIKYPVGSGLIFDSHMADEYAECWLKADILSMNAPHLIETFRWEPQAGSVRIDRHLFRLKTSAQALSYPYPHSDISAQLQTLSGTQPLKVRLTLSPQGRIHIKTEIFKPHRNIWQIALSQNPLYPSVQESRYKVSHRDFYEGERRRIQTLIPCDEVVFFNPDGELCEGSFTSIFIDKDGQRLTPALSCGLLPGVLRAALIETGQVKEARLTRLDLLKADKIYIGNSLRGLIEARLVSTDLF